MSNDIRTKAFVMRRVKYGETDRILTLLTEQGIISAMARGVRKEKSRLAGGIEMFCLSDIVVHESPRHNLPVLTSSKMLKYYSVIMSDFNYLNFASSALKQISHFAESASGAEYFLLMQTLFDAIEQHLPLDLLETWFYFNLAKTNGEQINLQLDTAGQPLTPDNYYIWDANDNALRHVCSAELSSETFLPPNHISAPEIKLMRLMLAHPPLAISRIKNLSELIPRVIPIARMINKL